MPFPEATTLQKVMIYLFITTILFSCISLIWIIIEKPDKVNQVCGQKLTSRGGGNSIFGNESEFLQKIQRDCITTQNPPMSLGLAMTINLATFAGAAFVLSAICAYISSKKNKKDTSPPTPPQK